MKKFWYYVGFFVFVLIVIPLIIIQAFKMFGDTPTKQNPKYNTHYVKVFNAQENKIVELEMQEYIKGVVAAEMPAEFHLEALKAQAVAARTYAFRRVLTYGDQGHPDHPGAHVCTTTHCKVYSSKQTLEKNKGKDWIKKYYPKIAKAVDVTINRVIVYNNIPIDALFHSTSSGYTENSEDVFVSSAPYLKSVESPYDKDSPKYKATYTTSVSTFINTLKGKHPSFTASAASIKNQVQILERSQSGTIKSIKIGNMTTTGSDIRTLFNLNSSNFTIKFQGDTVVIDTIGYGHGVGMSQYGANGYAKAGKKYNEILKIYYQGVKIVNMDHFIDK